MRAGLAALWLSVAALAGCVSDSATEAEFYCEHPGECRPGWACVANRCAPGPAPDMALDAAPLDMARDATPPIDMTPPVDLAPEDMRPEDMRPEDMRPEDGGPEDMDPADMPLPPDGDADGVPDGLDNCPEKANPDQMDVDGDGAGDLCDLDVDGDGYANEIEDACGSAPNDPASVPADFDEDGTCDPLDLDNDDDGFDDAIEIDCGSEPFDAASVPPDADGDGVCDPLDPDLDGDGFANDIDLCPRVASPGDNRAGYCARCNAVGAVCFVPTGPSSCATAGCGGVILREGRFGRCDGVECGGFGATRVDQLPCRALEQCVERGAAGICEASVECAEDSDRDTIPDVEDNCPLWYNPGQDDVDADGLGDACDFPCDADGACPGASEFMSCGPNPAACGGFYATAAFTGRCLVGQCEYVPQQQQCDAGERCGFEPAALGCQADAACGPPDPCADRLDGDRCAAAVGDADGQARCVAQRCVRWDCETPDCNEQGPRFFVQEALALQPGLPARAGDPRTGLEWWAIGQAALTRGHASCAALDPASPWRLPSIWELLTLQPRTAAELATYAEGLGFPPERLLSRTTTSAAQIPQVLVIELDGGSVERVGTEVLVDVVCVRESRATLRDHGQRLQAARAEPEFADPWTRLRWSALDPAPVTRDRAETRCQDAGRRLPTILELLSLFIWTGDPRPGYWPSWDGAQFNVLAGPVWAADRADGGEPWLIDAQGIPQRLAGGMAGTVCVTGPL